jgi:hypothetical protein
MSLSSGFEMCGIAIEDDKKRSGEMKADYEVMDAIKLVCWMVSSTIKTFYQASQDEQR